MTVSYLTWNDLFAGHPGVEDALTSSCTDYSYGDRIDVAGLTACNLMRDVIDHVDESLNGKEAVLDRLREVPPGALVVIQGELALDPPGVTPAATQATQTAGLSRPALKDLKPGDAVWDSHNGVPLFSTIFDDPSLRVLSSIRIEAPHGTKVIETLTGKRYLNKMVVFIGFGSYGMQFASSYDDRVLCFYTVGT